MEITEREYTNKVCRMVGSGPDLKIHVRNLEVSSTKTWTQNCLFSCDFTAMSQLKGEYLHNATRYRQMENNSVSSTKGPLYILLKFGKLQ